MLDLSTHGWIRRTWFASALLCLLVLASCVTLSETGRSVFILTSTDQENQLGASSFAEMKRQVPICTNSELNQRVVRVASRITAQADVQVTQWEVIVFQDATPNAFALPGGKIGVHTGILTLCPNDAALATVLGHEVAHVSLRHGGQRMSQQLLAQMGVQALGAAMQQNNWKTNQLMLQAVGAATQLGWILPFSRNNELEADRIGLRYMARAGYDPRESLGFWQRMAELSARGPGQLPEYFSTHPSDSRRIDQIRSLLPEALASYHPGAGSH